VLGASAAYLLYTPAATPAGSAPAGPPLAEAHAVIDAQHAAPPSTRVQPTRSAPRARAPVIDMPEEPHDLPSLDPNDVAAHIRPGDPEPTAAELIDALRHAGITSGIAAFNPPGTSPPLEGLAVPEDFDLPEGYMRHYQVTDEGEPIEAILMFSPDYAFYDADGNPIVIPEDRVVPPELAPPGMPIRPVRPPSP
jgi:hypothetical protein